MVDISENCLSGVPVGKTVLLLNTIGGVWPYLPSDDPSTQVWEWVELVQRCFNAKKSLTDYELLPGVGGARDSTVRNLMALPRCSVLAYCDHGVVSAGDEQLLGIYTSSWWSDEDWQALLGADFANLIGRNDWRVYIKPPFIRKYWRGKFDVNSFVFMNLCNSFGPGSEEFRRVLVNACARARGVPAKPEHWLST